jgi:transposase
LRRRLSREALLPFIANLKPCLIGIEACGGAHYWTREFTKLGHTVKMMSPQFVKPYVKSNKNDERDAEAIAEAVIRPTMRFVPLKSIEQQDILLLHRARELAMKQRVAQSNQIRGFLAEYGIVVSKGAGSLEKLPEILSEHKDKLTPQAHDVFMQLHEQLKTYSKQVEHYTKQVERHAAQDARCVAIQEIEGIGPITESAIVGTVSDASFFKSGREMAAWLGLVPKQHSSGNKVILGSISKRGV